jgi:3',5'-cyclic AMP phosphodiesterase CpdA
MTAEVRLAHFSDLHVTSGRQRWKLREIASKRLTGWMNLRLLGRGFRFRHAATVTRILVQELRKRRPDHFVFSGDATALAFESEFAAAARLLTIDDPDMPPGLAVPGNHDCYVQRPVTERLFERYFLRWQAGERVDGETYPFAQQVGHVWLIGLNSSTCNLLNWDARGRVGVAQRDRLRRLLAQLSPGPRILVTHYPLVSRRNRLDPGFRRLRDWKDTVAVAAEGGVSLWLHGHRHRPYFLPESFAAPFPVICAGSATQTNIWVYNEYTIAGNSLRGVRRVFCPKEQLFQDKEEFELTLK